MGANLTTLKDSKTSKSDADYCQLHLSAVFNDAYVQSICDELPEYAMLASPSDKLQVTPSVDQGPHDAAQAVKLQKLMTILAPTSSKANSQETEPSSAHDAVNRKSSFAANNHNRLRLLLRMYQVYINPIHSLIHFSCSS